MNCPRWILKITQRACILPALSLLHLYLCICVQLPIFAVSSGISKAPASSLQSTVPPNYQPASSTSFPIRQSLKNTRSCATLHRSFTQSFLQPAQHRAPRPAGPIYSKRTSDHPAHRRLPQDPSSYGYFRVQMVCSNHRPWDGRRTNIEPTGGSVIP
jgi:hypothetical protein